MMSYLIILAVIQGTSFVTGLALRGRMAHPPPQWLSVWKPIGQFLPLVAMGLLHPLPDRPLAAFSITMAIIFTFVNLLDYLPALRRQAASRR